MRIMHSADWQIGARFRQFGEAGRILRQARIATLKRALKLAAERGVEVFLVAGDLFEDDQVNKEALAEVWQEFASAPAVHVYILPGNHDPATGPGCIWARHPFSEPPPNVTIFTEPGSSRLPCGAVIVANPLRQKRSTVDPSLELAQIVAAVSDATIKIGMTHGSPALEGLYDADDFPIARDAATRFGLDYLAIGHWHGYQIFDEGRMGMPGTPEQCSFSEEGAGSILEVEIGAPGDRPKITRHHVGSLHWQVWECELDDPEHARAAVRQFLRRIEKPSESVVRAVLRGNASHGLAAEIATNLRDGLSACAVLQVVDQTAPVISEAERAEIRTSHPLLAAVLEDLDAIGAGSPALDLAAVCKEMNLERELITADVAARACDLLFTEMRSIERSC
jgi:DNA repair exonuclease SbcCD nuclease subunit